MSDFFNNSVNERLELFRGMIKAVDHLYTWTYAPDGTFLSCSCPPDQQPVLETLFFSCDFFQKILDYSTLHDGPYALGTYMGLVWFAVLEKKDGDLMRVHLLGPALHTPVQENQLENFLREYEKKGLPFYSKHVLIKNIRSLPVVFQKYFGQLALMLHYCVNQEHLPASKLHFLVDQQLDETETTAPALYRDTRLRTLRLLEHLRLGDIEGIQKINVSEGMNYCALPTNAAGIRTPLRALKDAAVIFTAQCADAAIDGGLSPEAAYSMADRYMGSMEQNRSPLELMTMMSSMYRTYLQCVCDARRQGRSFSPEIQSCMDYIDLHPLEPLEISDLADMVGYSAYYLSRKFHRETGSSIRDYIRQRKIKQGALLLVSTQDDLGTIAERLGFCSRSHFSDTFHKIMGLSPSEYRKQRRNFQTTVHLSPPEAAAQSLQSPASFHQSYQIRTPHE